MKERIDRSDAQAGRLDSAEFATRRREGQLAGLLFVACPLLSLPSSLLIEPSPPASIYLLTMLGMLTGGAFLLAPWERMSRGWLHLAGVLATAEVTAAVVISDSVYAFFYLLVALYAAYIARGRAELAGQLAVIGLGLIAPALIDPALAGETAKVALLAFPVLALAAALVMRVREQFDAEIRAYRSFAKEALALAARIRGKAATPRPPAANPSLPPLDDVRARPFPRPGRRLALGAAVAVVATPFAGVALAVAGVGLPRVVNDSFEELGVELPNQAEGEALVQEATSPTAGPHAGDRKVSAGRDADAVSPRPAQQDDDGGDAVGPQSGGAVAVGVVAGDAPGTEPPPAAAPPAPATPRTGPQAAIREAIDDGLAPVEELVDRLLPKGEPG
ncbi:MAG: hypothetical protein ACR2G3_09610 [Solirubrobacterales bacterium]